MTAKPKAKHAVIVCHPSRDSFTLSVAERYAAVAEGLYHEVVIRDLYRLGFDPVLKASEQAHSDAPVLADDVAAELALLAGTDVFVLIYPIWFGMPPAMLKGYIDRVLGAGFPYGAVRDHRWNPLMTGKRLVSFTSSGLSRAWLEEQGAWLSLRNVFDNYLTKAFSLAGNDHFHFECVTNTMGDADVQSKLLDVEAAARQICARFAFGDSAPTGAAPPDQSAS